MLTPGVAPFFGDLLTCGRYEKLAGNSASPASPASAWEAPSAFNPNAYYNQKNKSSWG